VRWNVSVAGLAAAWGFISVIVADVSLDAAVLVFYRLAFAAITVCVLALVTRRGHLLRPPPTWPGAVALGLVLGVHWTLYFLTIKLSSVVVAVVTVYTAPLFLAAVAPVFLPEARSRVALGALVPAVCGIVLIAFAGNGGGHVRPLAVLTGLGAGATYAMLVVGTKRLRLDSVHPFTIAFWTYSVAAVAVSPLLLVAGRVLPSSGREIGSLLLLGIVFTGCTGVLYVTLVGHVTAQSVGILAFLEPVSASLLAWAILGQSLSAAVLVGGALVLASGVAIVIAEPEDRAAIEAAGLGSPL
jgi:drug/metabolite transporter (DMT)-like permease